LKHSAVLTNPQQAHAVLTSIWPEIKSELMAGHKLMVKVEPEKRSDEQNRLLWAALSDVSRQVEWHGQKLEPEDWKHVFSAGLKRQRAVPGIDGGFVVLGQSTSKMTKADFSELIELIYAFGADRGVTFKEQ
jgi:hypothetical protein